MHFSFNLVSASEMPPTQSSTRDSGCLTSASTRDTASTVPAFNQQSTRSFQFAPSGNRWRHRRPDPDTQQRWRFLAARWRSRRLQVCVTHTEQGVTDTKVPFTFNAMLPAESAAKPKPPALQPLINLEKYLDSAVFSDVEFVIQSEKYSVSRTIRAHKQFLAMRNEVFGTMFFGSLPEKDKVLITDLHPNGFYGLLKYLYCGACLPDSFEEAIYIREAADKYLVPELVTVCSKYIAKHMDPERVCFLIDCLATTDIERIDAAALRLLRCDAFAVLNSESFVESHDTTVEIVLSAVCGVPESCVFLAIRRWAEERCRRSLSAGETPMEVDAVLRPFLPKLRFLALTPQEYVKGPGSWNLLKSNEDYAVLRNIIVRGSVPLPFWVCTDDTPRSQFREVFTSKPVPVVSSLSKVAEATDRAFENEVSKK